MPTPSSPVDAGDSSSAGRPIRLRLYIAGGAPNSLAAVRNLREITEERLPGACEVETVDVLLDPMRALTDRVVITPFLQRVDPLPQRSVAGSLKDIAEVISALELDHPNR